jgi:hypothetical protein
MAATVQGVLVQNVKPYGNKLEDRSALPRARMPLLGQIFRQGLFDNPGTRLGLCHVERAKPATWVKTATNFTFQYGELRMMGLVCNDRGTLCASQ